MPRIHRISTGVPGLDQVLGGGLPELSFNLVAGDPGAGKTTLAHQILFANATEERPALYVTVVGEPPVKMLRYQAHFDFYDSGAVGRALHYRNLADTAEAGGLEAVLEHLQAAVEELEPAFVVVDSFRSVARLEAQEARDGGRRFESFMQRLALFLTRWEATTFLLGEFATDDELTYPVFTVADGILRLRQAEDGRSTVRRLQVLKCRGQGPLPGYHSFRITDAGVTVYPRKAEPLPEGVVPTIETRAGTGIPALDDITSGGFPRGDSVIASGPSGTGKTVLGMHFVQAGVAAGEAVVVLLFEESEDRYRERARSLGLDMVAREAEGRIQLIRWSPLDLTEHETFAALRNAVIDRGASRVVIDSLSGLEVAVRAESRRVIRDALLRVVAALSEAGVTTLMTSETSQTFDSLHFTEGEASFLADDLILLRYVEIQGELSTVLAVAKMRRSGHSRAFHRFGIGEGGVEFQGPLTGFRGILTGVPQLTDGDTVSGRSEADPGEGRRGRGSSV